MEIGLDGPGCRWVPMATDLCTKLRLLFLPLLSFQSTRRDGPALPSFGIALLLLLLQLLLLLFVLLLLLMLQQPLLRLLLLLLLLFAFLFLLCLFLLFQSSLFVEPCLPFSTDFFLLSTATGTTSTRPSFPATAAAALIVAVGVAQLSLELFNLRRHGLRVVVVRIYIADVADVAAAAAAAAATAA